MEFDVILLRSGEIFLKGKNHNLFERKLISNCKKMLGIDSLTRLRHRFLIPYTKNHRRIRDIFGLVSYSCALSVEKDFEAIKKGALRLLADFTGTFKVRTKRSDKRFPYQSPQINSLVGQYCMENSKATFSFSEPQKTIFIEINQHGAFVFDEIVSCHGGLPVGCGGNIGVLIESESDILSALAFMRRGVVPYLFSSQKRDISLIERYSPHPLTLNNFTSLKEVEEFCTQRKISALGVGQHFENYASIDSGLVVLRPLISLSEQQIQEKLHKFEI